MRFRYSLRTLLIVGPLVACLLAASCVRWGHSGWTDFSPDTLELRSQTAYRLPVLDIPLYRTGYVYHQPRGELVEYLVEKGYWERREVEEPQWVRAYEYDVAVQSPKTHMLHQVLERDEYWIAWSEENPQWAFVIWRYYLGALRKGTNSGEAYDTLVSIKELSKRQPRLGPSRLSDPSEPLRDWGH